MFFINRELFVLKGLPYEKIRRKNCRKIFVKNVETGLFLNLEFRQQDGQPVR